MKYVQARNNIFERFLQPGEVVDFSSRCTNAPRDLEPEEAAEYGVSPLGLVTPPTYDAVTQSRGEIVPTLVGGVWEQTWAVTELFTAPSEKAAAIAAALVVVKADLSKQIDDAVIAIYDRPISLSKEYELREKAAAEYKATGYTGAVPARLAGYATPARVTPQVAADTVLTQAAQFRTALDTLSDLRMRKFEVRHAATDTEARAVCATIMARVAAVAAALT